MLETLYAQLENVRNAISKEGEEDAIRMLQAEEASILVKIEEIKRNEIVETTTSPDSSFVLAAGGYEADFRALTKGEDEYQVASITTQLYLSKLESDHQANVAALNSEVATANEKANLIDEELEQTRSDLADVRIKLENAMNQIADIEIERDGYKKEAESLRNQLEALRQQIDKPKIATNLEIGTALADAAARIEAKKIPVYNVRPGDFKESFYLAQLASTGEEIEIRPYYNLKSNYREVTPDEALQFRKKHEESNPELVEPVATNPDIPVEVPQLQFQTGEEPTVPEHILHRESTTEDAQTVSRAEFEALKLEVFARLHDIELHVHGTEYVDTGDAA